MNKKLKKAMLFGLCSSLSVGGIIAITLSTKQVNNIDLETNSSLKLETNPKNNGKVFNGTTLIKDEAIKLGWFEKPKITLADWQAQAPNVTQLGESSDNLNSGVFSRNVLLTSIEIPAKITSINSSAFEGATTLTSLVFERNSQLREIGRSAFQKTKLTEFTIPNGVNTLRRDLFGRETPIKRLIVNDRLNVVEAPFTDMIHLTYISIPLKYQDITYGGYWGLTDTQFNDVHWRPETFTGRVLDKATVIKLGWHNLRSITLNDWDAFAPNVIELGNPNINSGAGTDAPFQGNNILESIQIPDRITAINFAAFSDARQLNNIEFSANSQLTFIRGYAFKGTKLTNITIPARVGTITEFAFTNIRTLNQVSFANNSRTTTIGDSAFSNSTITSINIPDSITSIGNNAFQGTSSTLNGINVSMPRALQKNSTTPLYGFVKIQWDNISWRKNAFTGTVLTKQAVIDLGWDKVQAITLDDWRNFAPNVTALGNGSGSGEATAPFSFNNILTSIIIPKKVTIINFAAFHSTGALNSVTFESESQLREISSFAFKSSAIKNLTIPNRVTTIGFSAFLESSITNITLPNSLTSLAPEAFNGAVNLTSINIPVGIKVLERGVFKNTNRLQTVTFAANSGLNIIEPEVFLSSGIRNIIIPRSVTQIQESAFKKATSLTNLTFEVNSGLTTIGNGAFQETRIALLDIPNSVTNMHANALSLSESISQISMSSNLRKGSIGPLYGLNSTQWGKVVWKIQPFTNTTLKKVDVINLNWWGKQTITLEDWKLAPNVTRLGVDTSSGNINESPFASNTSLTSIVLPSKITHIGYGAFSGTTALKGITFQDNSSLTNIGAQAFDRSGITSINIPDLVTTIAANAFSNTTALVGTQISIPSRMRKGSATTPLYGFTEAQWKLIDWRIIQFKGTVLRKGDVIDLNWGEKTEITQNDWTKFAPNVTQISASSNTTNVNDAAFYNNKALTKIFIPAKITEINFSSFGQTTNLKTVDFEQNSKLTLIGNSAFKNSGVLRINVPSTTKVIGYEAFSEARSLSAISFTDDSQLEQIHGRAFLNARALEEIIIPKKTKAILETAFWNAKSLKKVYIPDSVTNIGEHVFNGTDSLQGQNVSMPIAIRGDNPTRFKYGFTQAQWNNINWRGLSFTGTILNKENVIELGWNSRTSITLEDWKNVAPKVTQISADAISGDASTAAFSDNTILRSIEIPKTITRINYGSFRRASALQTITFEPGSSLSSIGDVAFASSSIQSIEIPDSVRSIGPNTFAGTTKLKTIKFPYRENLLSSNGAYNSLYGLTQDQWNSIEWRNVPTKDVKLNSIIAKNLLKEDSIITWEELLPFTGIESQTFAKTNITGITLKLKEGFIVDNDTFLETTELKDIEMDIQYLGGVETLGFSEEQLKLIKFINDGEVTGVSQNILILAASLSGLSLLVTVAAFGIIIKRSKNHNEAEKTSSDENQ